MENDVICISSEEDCDDQVLPRKFNKDKETGWIKLEKVDSLLKTEENIIIDDEFAEFNTDKEVPRILAKVNTLLKSEETIIIDDEFTESNKKKESTWIETRKFERFIASKKPINGISIKRNSINKSSKMKNIEISNGEKTLNTIINKNENSLSDVTAKQASKVNKSISSNNTLNGHNKSEKIINDDINKHEDPGIAQNPIFKTGEVSILKRKDIINNDILIDKVVPTSVKRLRLSGDNISIHNSVSSFKSHSNQVPSSSVSNENSSHSVNERNSPTPGCSWYPEVEKPKLIVKEKKILYDDEFDLFSTFIETCLKRDFSDDMKEIVKKLKRRHERLHPSFVNSDWFKKLLIDKQKMIDSNEGKLFVHIQEVNDEMKSGVKKSRFLENNARKAIDNDRDEDDDEEEKEIKEDEDRDKNEERRIRKKLKTILNSIEVCKKRIKQLEEEEVDLDDDQDSSYLMEDRYKRKLMQLWNAFCKYSGEKVDAGRAYLRPKHISATSIPQVDQAIMSFINAKISQRNDLMVKGKSIADTVIFPDYIDILNCIAECNEKKNLGLSKVTQEDKAKEAFTKIGEYLQRVRQSDYWDTFALFLEEEDDDPALKDSSLAEKLGQNYVEGKRKMNSLFEEYTQKQENRVAKQNKTDEMIEDEDETEDDEEEDEEEEYVEVDEDLKEKKDEDNDDEDHEMLPMNESKDADVSTSLGALNTEKQTQDSPTHTTKDHSNAENDSLPQNSSSEVKNSSSKGIDVIEIDEEPLNADKQPVLRLRSFAKPPTSWKDSLPGEGSPVIKKFATSTPKASVSKISPAFVDLTSEKVDTTPLKAIRRPLDAATMAALKSKFKAVVIPSNFKGKQIISVKNITNNYNVLNGPGNAGLKSARVVTSVSHKSPDGSQTIIRVPSQSSSHLKQRNPLQMRVNKIPDKVLRKINEKTFSTNLPIMPKPSGNRQVFYQPTANPNIFTNPEGQIVRVKTIVPNQESKVMKVLNLSETQKVSITPLQKHRVTNKVTLNQKPNQSNVQLNPKQLLAGPRIDHQYSKRIVNNVVRIMKPGEQNYQNIHSGRLIKKI